MSEEQPKLSKEDLLKMLAEQIHAIERLPPHAKFSFVTNADLAYVISILYGLLDTDDHSSHKEDSDKDEPPQSS